MRSRSSANLKSQARLELFARQHRSGLTESEAALWSAHKARQLGVSFRRQVPVAGLFIADLSAATIQLVVEVDGPNAGAEGPCFLATVPKLLRLLDDEPGPAVAPALDARPEGLCGGRG